MIKTFSVVHVAFTMKYSTSDKNALLSFISVFTGCIMDGCRLGLEVNIHFFDRRQQFKIVI